ncbi:2-oxoacid:acceptor oxidoreductase family protein [Endomicrobium proavitum]|uniref:Indolepyruvate ferredoxin oxidoreductase n=1 Tax=Endomicrobium proavitum TaxID=1408281 RepID=A0A0G3WKU8_9BACT|nr:2-oxoacid:acceptor oxidoreductase family protein [Endomicrobium proavitum]AKL98495.1 indolepyruvate ferredoxin oxidoreductase [Endomicrobium proavitum]
MKEKTVINILFCGTGGQGVLTAAEIVSLASMYDGYHTKKSEVHGMAQRGGSVESHVRFACKVCNTVASPLIEEGAANFLVPFYKSERDRLLSFLAPDGVDMLKDLEEANNLPNKKFINTFMLGRLSKHLNITQASWLKALEVGFKGKLIEENRKVFLEAANRIEA